MSPVMIECSGINKYYGNIHVLKDIALTVDKGEVVTIVGASGAGKSTLLQILGTLLKPDSGILKIDGTEPLSLDEKGLSAFRNSRIGFVFQFHHLLPEFTALENVMMPALIAVAEKRSSLSAHAVRERALEILSSVGLGERFSHRPAQMSGGEQQRVAIARALINNPAVLFADEPSGNLDSRTKEELHSLFFDLRAKLGQTIVIVTHDRELAKRSDRTLEMRDGEFI